MLLGVPQHMLLERGVVRVDLEVGDAHGVLRVGDGDDPSTRLPDADGPAVDVSDQRMEVHVLPAGLHPVDVRGRGIVRSDQEATDRVVVGGVVVVPERRLQHHSSTA
ncbi:MAG: hypothetical protein U9R72_04630 [Chloroflexota bacterium]|nr:hypothetical protein [Chloroflexota bacterium]